MYHQQSGVSSRIVTIQYPEVLIVLDYDRMQQDPDGHLFPTVLVFSALMKDQIEPYLDSFNQGSLDDEMAAVCVDSWPDDEWTASTGEELQDRHYLTTFVTLPQVREFFPTSRVKQ